MFVSENAIDPVFAYLHWVQPVSLINKSEPNYGTQIDLTRESKKDLKSFSDLKQSWFSINKLEKDIFANNLVE